MPTIDDRLQRPRFGSDIGGVITRQMGDRDSGWHLQRDSEVPGAVAALREIVHRFKADNVFIVSRAGHKMQRLLKTWLHETMNFCGRTGAVSNS